jgi:hypothetical protein
VSSRAPTSGAYVGESGFANLATYVPQTAARHLCLIGILGGMGSEEETSHEGIHVDVEHHLGSTNYYSIARSLAEPLPMSACMCES